MNSKCNVPNGKATASGHESMFSHLNIPTELHELGDDLARLGSKSYRIALLIPLCGSAGLWAPSCISSAQVAAEQLNRGGGIDGRKVQLIMIDAAQEARISIEETVNDLIETRAIDAIVGMHISAIRQRLGKIVRQRIPYIYTPLYEGGEGTRGLFAIGDTPDSQLAPSMAYIQAQYRPKNWALIGNDYVWPRISHGYAKARLRGMGAGLVYERYLPFGLSTMSRHVEEIAASGAEAVLMSLVGQDAVAFNRAFGRAELDQRIIRLSCAIEENGLLASGPRNSKRLFVASSYFSSLPTEANASFKEQYYALHGDQAPVLNALGQSTYEGVHFLAGLVEDHAEIWRGHSGESGLPVSYRSGRKRGRLRDAQRAPVFLARAEGLGFSVIKSFKTDI